MKKNPIILGALLLLALAQPVAAWDNNLQDALNQQYLNRTLTLRHPFQNNFQVYGEKIDSGKNGIEGPWALYGRMRVTKIELESGRLQLEGKRIEYQSDRKEKKLAGHEVKQTVKIEIRLKQPLASEEQARAALGLVFALDYTDVPEVTTDLWRSVESLNLGETIYAVPEAKPPKARHTPEPYFPHGPGSDGAYGTVALTVVVDRTGKVAQVVLSRPTGHTMDESAVEAVKRWTFEPATLNGVPVAVEVTVEVSFEVR
ncbi:MAG: energy transducer TonB [Acidobacteriia bacterium]|nr:energy transducer TonB [Terriglobia bacterium]